jgi:hypothetical protein
MCARTRTRSNPRSESFGGTLLKHCEPAVRRRFTGRGVAGRDCSSEEFQNTDSDRYESDEGSRSVHARRGVEPLDRIPPARMSPSESSVLLLRGLSFSSGSSPHRAVMRRACMLTSMHPFTCEGVIVSVTSRDIPPLSGRVHDRRIDALVADTPHPESES